MIKLRVLAAMSAIAMLSTAPVALGDSFYDALVTGPVNDQTTGDIADAVAGNNLFEDQSREVIVDVDDDGALSEGDVFLGWVRLDDRSIPTDPPASIGEGDLYGIFTIQVGDLTITDVTSDLRIYEVDFTPTTVSGLTLEDLIGTLPGSIGTNEDPVAALFEDVGINLIDESPGDLDTDGDLTVFDFIAAITGGNLDIIAGFDTSNGGLNNIDPIGPANGSEDHFEGLTFLDPEDAVGNPIDPFENLALLAGVPITGGIGSSNSFHAAMSILFDSRPGCDAGLTGGGPYGAGDCWGPVFDFTETPFPNGSAHSLTIVNGDISGCSDCDYTFNGGDANPFFFNKDLDNVNYDFYGLSDNADIVVAPIPEPGVLALLGLGLLGVAAAGRRRRIA